MKIVIYYGLIVYYHSLTQRDKNKIYRIQYFASKLVGSTMHLTSKVKLEKDLGCSRKGKFPRINSISQNCL